MKTKVYQDHTRGTGKSNIKNNIDIAQMAWIGIAANLLINEETLHTTFKLPLYIFENTTCGIKFN